jgi:basic amino acid/polyamine antiporter, APA family
MVDFPDIDAGAPIADAFDQVGLGWASALISLAAVAGLTSVILVDLITVTRIGFSMGRDGLLPQSVAKVSPRTGTPVRMTLLFAVLVLVMATFVPLGALADLVSIGTLFAFLLVSVAVPVLRRTRPELRRPFRVPFSPVVPVLSALACLYLMLNLSIETWLRFLAWLALGMVIYAIYGYRHSRVGDRSRQRAEEPDLVVP